MIFINNSRDRVIGSHVMKELMEISTMSGFLGHTCFEYYTKKDELCITKMIHHRQDSFICLTKNEAISIKPCRRTNRNHIFFQKTWFTMRSEEEVRINTQSRQGGIRNSLQTSYASSVLLIISKHDSPICENFSFIDFLAIVAFSMYY